MASDTLPLRRSRRGSGAVTLHDVAKLAGVAPITASRAVKTPALVSEDVRKKVHFDLEYIANQSLWFDFKIMVLTLPVMLFRKGAH